MTLSVTKTPTLMDGCHARKCDQWDQANCVKRPLLSPNGCFHTFFLDLWKEIGTNQVCMLINSARSSISGSVNDNGWDFYFGNLK